MSDNATMNKQSWVTRQMDSDFAESGDARKVADDWLTGLCILACCVEHDLYCEYHEAYNSWANEHVDRD
jgi:hypothetical protein